MNQSKTNIRNKLAKLGITKKLLKDAKRLVNDYALSKNKSRLKSSDQKTEEIDTRYLEYYIASLLLDNRSMSTIKIRLSIIYSFKLSVSKDEESITTLDAYLWLFGKDLSQVTIESYRVTLNKYFKWLCNNEFIKNNPMCRIKPITQYQGNTRAPFSENEVEKIRSVCKTTLSKAIVELLLCTGIRVSELCTLQLSDVDFENKTIKINGHKARTLPITDITINALNTYLDSRKTNSDLLFTSYGNKLTTDMVLNALSVIEDKCGFNTKAFRFRLTYISNLSQN